MNKNIKIAKELIKLAKSLMADDQTEKQRLIQEAFDKNDYETLYSYMKDGGWGDFFTNEQRQQLINMLVENHELYLLRGLVIDCLNDDEKKIAFKYFLDKRDTDGLSEYLYSDGEILTKEQKLNAIEILVKNGYEYILEAWDDEQFSQEQKKQIIKYAVNYYDDDQELQELWDRCDNGLKQFWNDYVEQEEEE